MKIALLLTLLVLATGCETLMAPIGLERAADPGITVQGLGDEVLVFGRLRWIENDVLRTDYNEGGMGWRIYPMILDVSSMDERIMPVEPDGRFYWILPRGTYMLYRLQWFDPIDGQHRLESTIAFQATGEYHGYYLGVLEIQLEGKRDLLGGLWIKNVDARVRDESGQDVAAFRDRQGDTGLELAGSLMVVDSNLPRDPGLENRARLAEIMRSLSFGLMTLQY